MLRGQLQLAPEEAERVARGGDDRAEREAPTAAADRARAPGDALMRADAGDVPGVVAGQRRAVGHLDPELRHPRVVFEGQALFNALTNLRPATERRAFEREPARAEGEPHDGEHERSDERPGQHPEWLPA